MSMTIRELIGVPALRSTLVAGSAGVDREVTWAHSCEIPSPWEWMGSNELLMTTGRNVPEAPLEQVAFLRGIDGAGLSGIALAEGMDCPPVSAEMKEEADRLGLPVLSTGYEVPFVAISRVVADSVKQDSQARLTKVLRVYDTYRVAVNTKQPQRELFAQLAAELRLNFEVLDVESGRQVMSGSTVPRLDVVKALKEARGQAPQLPAISRIHVGSQEKMVLPIGPGDRWALVVETSGQPADLLVLQHVGTIMAIEAERHRASAEARLSSSSRLLTQLVARNIDTEMAADRLRELGVDRPPWCVVSSSRTKELNALTVQGMLVDANEPHLVASVPGGILVLGSPYGPMLEILQGMSADARMGVSSEITSVGRIADAAREADWARQTGRVEGKTISFYATDRPLFLPRTVAEAEDVVKRVLGPLLDYDAEHSTDLVESLRVFFDSNRSWQVASKALMVHKQTLVYRMRRVGELTGRKLDNLDDIAELHLALRTLNLLSRT